MGLDSPLARPSFAIAPLCLVILGLTGSSVFPQGPNSGPQARSTPENSPPSAEVGPPAETVWLNDVELRGGGASTLYDNGPPLDDFGHPSSQLSQSSAPWGFIAAAADDFQIDGPPDTAVRITTVRVATHFFQTGSAGATPMSTWTGGVYVTIYSNTPANVPSGQPNDTGGQTGTVVASQLVPAASLTNQTLVNSCRPCYLVDIPVDILLAKNTKYWLSVVPKFNAPPQSAWVISANQNPLTFVSKYGFPPTNVPFWEDLPGNTGSCPGAPAAGTRKDLSFVLIGTSTVPSFGACCDGLNGSCSIVENAAQCSGPFQTFNPGDTCQTLNPSCSVVTGACCNAAGSCMDNVLISNCAIANRFVAGVLCANLVPACGDNTPGACCIGGGGCTNLSALDCDNAGGIWHAGTCTTFTCPPSNDNCANKIVITSDVVVFDTSGATTDGPDDGDVNCATPQQDVWYSYTAPCTGQLFISLCQGTNYDSIVAVYEGCACPAANKLACDDDSCSIANGPSQLDLAVTQGACYLIRVGGSGPASGPGAMRLTCIPPSAGACCHLDGSCTIEPSDLDCDGAGEIFTLGQPCSPITCPPLPTGACCFNPPTCTEGMTAFDCAQAGGIYNGDNSTCSAPPCPTSSLGACCFSDGTCQDLTSTDCQPAVGFFAGEGLLCASNPCPPLLGACCIANQQCIITTSTDCGAQAGTYQGDGSTCSTHPCPPANDECSAALPVTEGDTLFNTTGATDSGEPGTPQCVAPSNDVWFKYVAACTGTVQIRLCPGTTFNAAVTAHIGGECPALGAIHCDLMPGGCGPGENTSIDVNGVTLGDTIWIRIGSTDASTGPGVLRIHCVPGNNCCRGDMNDDGLVNLADVLEFANALVTNPAPGMIQFCRADVNSDNLLNGYDVGELIPRLTQGINCSLSGACCFPDGHCEVREEGPCKDVNGDFQGGGSTCSPNNCPVATGACCVGNACQILTFDQCLTVTGAYLGDNIPCTPDPCAPPQPSCCKADVSLNCQIDEQDIPAMVDGLLGSPPFNTAQACAADMNNDGSTDGTDLAAFIEAIINSQGSCLTCCNGDANNDGLLDGRDVSAFVTSLLQPPQTCSLEFCRTDVNANGFLDLNDVDSLEEVLLNGIPCPP